MRPFSGCVVVQGKVRELHLLMRAADAFTYLGINAGNEWGIKASLFSSKDILSGIKKE